MIKARLEGLEQVHASDARRYVNLYLASCTCILISFKNDLVICNHDTFIRYDATLANMETDFARAKEQLVSENMEVRDSIEFMFLIGSIMVA